MATMSSLGLGVAKVPNAQQFAGSFNDGVKKQNHVLVRAAQQDPQAEQDSQSSRRAVLGALTASIAAGVVLAVKTQEARALTPIKVGPPPPPSGGLPGTENSDQPRELELPLKERFFLQALPPSEAINRIKDASKEIEGVKTLIAKKYWPDVQSDLRLKATYLRFDIDNVVKSKPKEERKELKKYVDSLYKSLEDLDFAAREKDEAQANKCYSEAVAALDTVISKLSVSA